MPLAASTAKWVSSRPVRWELAFALAAATLALIASIVAAVGPARGEHAEYVWPPATLPASTPIQGWYAPLPLLNRVPSAIEARLPCALSPALRRDRQVAVLATARHPRQSEALWIARSGGSLRIGVGPRVVASAPWPESCPLRVEVEDGALSLPGRTLRLRTATLEDMPVVTGLFSGLDLSVGEPPAVAVRTRDYATSWTPQQLVAGALAVSLVLAALILLARPYRRNRPLRSFRVGIRSAWAERDGTDAVVVGALLIWWIVAPTFFDDSWVSVEHRAFDDLGANAFYYDMWGITSPTGYWFEWLRHWAGGATSDLVVMRIPTLAALLVAWFVTRWCLSRALSRRPASGIRWTLAGAFLVGATAWGMTLRPEPFVALLVLVNLAAMVSFVHSPRVTPLAIAVPIAVLAANAHPTGILALAPLLAAAPEVISRIRAGGRHLLVALGVLLLAGLALALILFTIDADLGTRIADARISREGALHSEPWWREYIRYARFDDYGGATAARRLSVAVLVLSAVAWLGGSRSRHGVLALPARRVAAGLVVLAFVPSKWPWHFGALLAVGAVATAAEVARLARKEGEIGRKPVRPPAALVVFGAAAIWAWGAAGEWAPLDLQRVSWSDPFGDGGRLVVALVLVIAVAAATLPRRRSSERAISLAVWAVPIVSFAVVGITVALLAIDAAITPWSPARQNLEALAGRKSCGLAHHLTGDGDVLDQLADPKTPSLIAPPIGLYIPCARIPRIEAGLVEVPRLIGYQSSPWPLEEKDGPFRAVVDLYELRSVATGSRAIEVLRVADRVPDLARVDARRD